MFADERSDRNVDGGILNLELELSLILFLLSYVSVNLSTVSAPELCRRESTNLVVEGGLRREWSMSRSSGA